EIADREPDLLDASLAHLKGGEVESREGRLIGKLPLAEAGRHLAQSLLRPALPAEADLDPGFEPAQLEPLGRPRRRRVERSSAREDGAGEREEPGAGKAGGEGVDGGESELRIAPRLEEAMPRDDPLDRGERIAEATEHQAAADQRPAGEMALPESQARGDDAVEQPSRRLEAVRIHRGRRHELADLRQRQGVAGAA